MEEKRTVQPLSTVKMIENNIGIKAEISKRANLENRKTMIQSKKLDTKQSATNVQQRQHVQGKEGSKVASNSCSELTERLAVQGSIIQFAADPTSIQEEVLRDGANAEKDQAKYGGANSHLLRSGRSFKESKESKIGQETTNANFTKSLMIQELKVDEVGQRLRDEDWCRVGQRGKVLYEEYGERKLESRKKNKIVKSRNVKVTKNKTKNNNNTQNTTTTTTTNNNNSNNIFTTTKIKKIQKIKFPRKSKQLYRQLIIKLIIQLQVITIIIMKLKLLPKSLQTFYN
jgi:hypothetical protein